MADEIQVTTKMPASQFKFISIKKDMAIETISFNMALLTSYYPMQVIQIMDIFNNLPMLEQQAPGKAPDEDFELALQKMKELGYSNE